MSQFFDISTPRDELNYLKLVEKLNSNLYAKYENEFFEKNNIQREYENIFKPITEPLHKSLKIQQQQQQNDKNKKIKTDDKDLSDLKEEDEEVKEVASPKRKQRKKKFSIEQFLKDQNSYGNQDMVFGIKATRKKSGIQFYSFLGKSIHISKDRKFIINPNSSQKNSVPTERLWEIIVLNPPTFTPTIKELEDYGEILLFNDYDTWAELKKNKSIHPSKIE